MDLGAGQEATKKIFLSDAIFHFETEELEKFLEFGFKSEATWYLDTPDERRLLSEEQLEKLQATGKIRENPDGKVHKDIILGIITSIETAGSPELPMVAIFVPESKSVLVKWGKSCASPEGHVPD